MYLTSGFRNSTTVIDGKNDTAIKTIPLEGIPEAIAFDPSNGRMLVTLNVHLGAISVIDDKTNAVIENIPLKMETLKIDLNPINGNLYVRNTMDRTIGIIEPG